MSREKGQSTNGRGYDAKNNENENRDDGIMFHRRREKAASSKTRCSKAEWKLI